MNKIKERCEYNPKLKEPSLEPARATDCKNEASWCVGHKGKWHLCDSCAGLPEFKKYRSRSKLKRGHPEHSDLSDLAAWSPGGDDPWYEINRQLEKDD